MKTSMQPLMMSLRELTEEEIINLARWLQGEIRRDDSLVNTYRIQGLPLAEWLWGLLAQVPAVDTEFLEILNDIQDEREEAMS